MSFLDELARLNAQSFGEGFVKFGEAVKEQTQNEALTATYEKFKAERQGLDELMTKDERLGEMQSYINKSGGNVINKKGDVGASLNLFKFIDQMKATQDLYAPFITSFATLGEDGVRIANSLSNELANKIDLIGKKSEIPIKELAFQDALLNYTWNKEKYNDYVDNKKQVKELNQVEDAIVNSPFFKSIKMDQSVYANSKYGDSAMTEYLLKVDNLTKAIKEQFPNVSEGVISQSVGAMLDAYHKTIKSQQVNPADIMNALNNSKMNSPIGTYTVQEVNASLNTMRWISQEYRMLTPNMKENLRLWVSDPTLLDEETLKVLTQDGRMKNLYDAFAPGGTYDQANLIVSSTFGGDNWYSVNRVNKGGSTLKIGLNTPVQTQESVTVGGYDVVEPNEYKEIIRAKSGYDILNGTMIYDPGVEDNIKQQLEIEKQKRLKGSLFNRGNNTEGIINKVFDHSYSTGKE